MCARITIVHSMQEIMEYFGVENPAEEAAAWEYGPRYNVAPTDYVPAALEGEVRHVEPLYWGLVPSWAKEKKVGSRMINARSETLTEKPAYRSLLTRRRCIVPVDGFYEWIASGKARQPLHIQIANRPIFGIAGLWDKWRQPDGETLHSVTLITVPANEMMSEIHDRMPAILRREDEDAWLDPTFVDPEGIVSLLQPYDSRAMTARKVSPIVNKPGIEGPECIAPLEEEIEPPPDQTTMEL